MNKLAWVLKRVYEMKLWKNTDGSFGADVQYNEGTEPVVFGSISLEWLIEDVERSLIAYRANL